MATAQTPAPKPAPEKSGPHPANPAHSVIPKEAKAPSPVQKPVVLFTAAVLAILAIGLGIWLFWGRKNADQEPSLQDLTEVIAKFMASKGYEKLPFERQKVYMRVMDKREDKGELIKAYRDRKITPAEYRTGLGEAWLGKHLNRVEKYFEAQGIVAKNAVLDQYIDSKEEKDLKPPKPGAEEETIPPTDGGTPLPKIKVDKTAEKTRIATFPQEVQDQWKKFDKAYKARKKQREAADAQEHKATPNVSTRPSTATGFGH